MGKLYELVKFRNRLADSVASLTLTPAVQSKVEVLNVIKNTTYEADSVTKLNHLIDEYQTVAVLGQSVLDKVSQAVNTVNQEIDTLARTMFTSADYLKDFSELNISHDLPIKFEIENLIGSKISYYADWHYPALQLTPRYRKWTDFMAACDPMYFTHHSMQTLTEFITVFPDQYQRRARLYEVANRDFTQLPQNQFGFVLCWDMFNQLSIDKVEEYIKAIFPLLRPGGMFMFSYANCDLESIAYRAETNANAYASCRLIKAIVEKYGYEIVEVTDLPTDDAFNTHVSWMEVRKPGVLKTLKAQIAMGEICLK